MISRRSGCVTSDAASGYAVITLCYEDDNFPVESSFLQKLKFGDLCHISPSYLGIIRFGFSYPALNSKIPCAD
jgi:hypothetical protein